MKLENLEVNQPDLHILLVEDSDEDAADLLEELEFGLNQHYNFNPFFKREKSVSGGLGALQGAIDAGQPYDFAILDYKLPQTDGGNPIGSMGIPEFIDGHPDCCDNMVQLTSLTDDPDVIRFWNRRKSDQLLFSKHSQRRLMEFIQFHEIENALEKLSSSSVLNGKKGMSPNEIGWLCGRIKVTWEDLGEETQEKIRKCFKITELENGHIRIGFKM